MQVCLSTSQSNSSTFGLQTNISMENTDAIVGGSRLLRNFGKYLLESTET